MSEAFDLGVDAYNDGKDRSENPYQSKSDNWMDWNEGFDQAEQDAGEGKEEDDD